MSASTWCWCLESRLSDRKLGYMPGAESRSGASRQLRAAHYACGTRKSRHDCPVARGAGKSDHLSLSGV